MLTVSPRARHQHSKTNEYVLGFNVAPISNPGSFEDIVELLVPELQRRGLMQTEYAVPGGTLRENLTRKTGQQHLMDDHYGATFAWERNPGKDIRSVDRNGSSHQMTEKLEAISQSRKKRKAEISD
jgi:hypothetical protein